MRMPGFTADQSLYRQTARSYSVATSRAAVGGNAVVPQGLFDFVGDIFGGIFGGINCAVQCGLCLATCGTDVNCWLAKCGPGCLQCIPH
jgi:hypothetical protein